eukprot:TRINITY_DN60734_c0_g1_i1.p1 TRINITY_DN60734_c0_g1~~TRINITY_DN60734_c0_g1_i1.p1  ORF type:complete len:113 (+),score=13.70 TRINITY_DN60734_c0_g1_i1:106-444(+)
MLEALLLMFMLMALLLGLFMGVAVGWVARGFHLDHAPSVDLAAGVPPAAISPPVVLTGRPRRVRVTHSTEGGDSFHVDKNCPALRNCRKIKTRRRCLRCNPNNAEETGSEAD